MEKLHIAPRHAQLHLVAARSPLRRVLVVMILSLTASGLIACRPDAPARNHRVRDSLESFCQETLNRVQQYATDYHGVDGIRDPTVRSARLQQMELSSSFQARYVFVSEIRQEIGVCLFVREFDRKTYLAYADEYQHACSNLVDARDAAAAPSAMAVQLDALAQALEKINRLPYADDEVAP